MTKYICIEVNSTKRTVIKTSSPKKAIEMLYKKIPTAENARVVGNHGNKEVCIHYNDTGA